ncbi:MAG TPA: TAXI family TRAP transporter solute-binding subunit [Myxococcales bacterium]
MAFSRLKMSRVYWRDAAVTVGPFVVLVVAAFWVAFHYVRPAPPRTIVMTAGTEGSSFQISAERYREILARQGVTLKIIPSQGSLENLKRLSDPKFKVDIGFVQGGLSSYGDPSRLMSLGSVFYVPVLIFYKAPRPIRLLSELQGKRIAIGREGSGARVLAEALLKANEIEAGGPTKLLDLEGAAAQAALLKGQADAIFAMGDSATRETMRSLLHTSGIRLFDFDQADGYVRRFRYLTKIELPPGSIDLGKNTPASTLELVAPTAELIARTDLHPALSDVLIEAAREVHGRATLLQKAGEFPAPLEHEYRLSDDAVRYYKSGKTFAYKHLPFWIASLVDRALVLLVPIAVLLIPGFRIVPLLYRWRINARIYRRYGELMALERVAFGQTTAQQRADLLRRLDEIERRVITVKLPASVAEQVYVLRQHLQFVRSRIMQSAEAAAAPQERAPEVEPAPISRRR